MESRDDAICLKSSLALGARRPTEWVVVTGCDLVNARNGLKIGTETAGDFRHIVFRNCTMTGRSEILQPPQLLAVPSFPSAGVSIQNVDGGPAVWLRSTQDCDLRDVRSPGAGRWLGSPTGRRRVCAWWPAQPARRRRSCSSMPTWTPRHYAPRGPRPRGGASARGGAPRERTRDGHCARSTEGRRLVPQLEALVPGGVGAGAHGGHAHVEQVRLTGPHRIGPAS